VGIAENLKLCAQNILDSDLTEVIDDYSMENIPFKANEIIQDVMTTTQTRITRLTEQGGKGGFGDGELNQIDEGNELDRQTSNASPQLKFGGGDDISKRDELNLTSGMKETAMGMRESVASLNVEDMDINNQTARGI
jgi:hypothetical protein